MAISSQKRETTSVSSDGQTGFIELCVYPPKANLWTVVQWQDSEGCWHDEEGWQGTPEGGFQVWLVCSPQFGKGPFRWVVLQGRDSPTLAESTEFFLPREERRSVQVDVILDS